VVLLSLFQARSFIWLPQCFPSPQLQECSIACFSVGEQRKGNSYFFSSRSSYGSHGGRKGTGQWKLQMWNFFFKSPLLLLLLPDEQWRPSSTIAGDAARLKQSKHFCLSESPGRSFPTPARLRLYGLSFNPVVGCKARAGYRALWLSHVVRKWGFLWPCQVPRQWTPMRFGAGDDILIQKYLASQGGNCGYGEAMLPLCFVFICYLK